MKWLLGLLFLIPILGFSQNTIKVAKPDLPVHDTAMFVADSTWNDSKLLGYSFYYGQYQKDFAALNSSLLTNFKSPVGFYGVMMGDLSINRMSTEKVLGNIMYSGLFPHRIDVSDTVGYRYTGNSLLLNFGLDLLSFTPVFDFIIYGGFGTGNEKLKYFNGNEKYRYHNRGFLLNVMAEFRIKLRLTTMDNEPLGLKIAAHLGYLHDTSSSKWKTRGDGDLQLPNSRMNGFYGMISLGIVAFL
jgi:hypothetical protein